MYNCLILLWQGNSEHIEDLLVCVNDIFSLGNHYAVMEDPNQIMEHGEQLI